MLRGMWLLAGIFLLPGLTISPSPAQQATSTPNPPLEITSPRPGEALQGVVAIIGCIPGEKFAAAELTFGYKDDPTQTWFFITAFSSPGEGALAEWDTTPLTDGEYTLRLSVIRSDGSRLDATVSGLRVRNYTPIETSTPTPPSTPTPLPPGEPSPTPERTASPTVTITSIRPTATPLPPNPAELTHPQLLTASGKGALAVIGLFASLGVYWLVKNVKRKT